MDPLLKLVALSVFVAAVYTGLYYRFVRPRVHYLFDGFLQGMLFFLLLLTRMCAVQLGWIPASYPGYPWLASSQELLSMLVANFLTSMVVVFIGSLLQWFPESASWERLAERARAARQAKLAAQALRDRPIDPTR